jgi:hypothetical protein
MNKFYLSLTLFFSLCLSVCYAQTYTYNFNNNLNESAGGPTLTEVVSCSAAQGGFASQLVTTTAGSCNAAPQTVFAFNEGGGLAFPNNSTIGATYTIHVFFKFNALSGYQRIIDFLDGSTDVGLYTLNDCLNFYPNGNVGACPYFVANKFYLLTLVRDGATNTITVYINGTSFGTYNDAALTYVPSTATTPIVFFRDNIASSAQCEDRDGSIKYLSVSAQAATATEVNATWMNICSIALPVTLVSFTAAKSTTGVLLNWRTASESNVSRYEIERSADGRRFLTAGSVIVRNNPAITSYSYNDESPLQAVNFYRLRIVDRDGSYRYSAILKINSSKDESLQVYPNPAHTVITLSGIRSGKTIRLLTADGRTLKQLAADGDAITVSVEDYPPGLYILEYSAGDHVERQKLVKY